MSRWAAILLAIAFLFCAVETASQTVRIGTFDRRTVALAYYRSPQWADLLQQKRAELAEAKRAGDTAKAEKLEAWGGQSQDLAMQQVFGNAPIDNVVAALAPAFTEIEKQENVSSVVPAPAAQPAAVQVDVTNRLLDWLHADEQTRKLISQMPKQ